MGKTIQHNYFIVQLSQIGNVGANEIQKIKDQPNEGFENEKDAEDHLFELFITNRWPYSNSGSHFSVMKLFKRK